MEEYFRNVYGDRWTPLRRALREEVRHVALANPFSSQATERQRQSAGGGQAVSLMGCRVWKAAAGQGYAAPTGDAAGIKAWCGLHRTHSHADTDTETLTHSLTHSNSHPPLSLSLSHCALCLSAGFSGTGWT